MMHCKLDVLTLLMVFKYILLQCKLDFLQLMVDALQIILSACMQVQFLLS